MIKEYLWNLSELLKNLPEQQIEALIQLLQDVRDRGGMVFVFGNGGSATTASHFACDLGKSTVQEGRPRFRVATLHDVATFSAYANDYGYEMVFAEPLQSLGQPGDIAIGISASGNSSNVLRAMDVAQRRGLRTVGLIGYQGGKLKDKVDLCIIVPSEDMQHIEDAHQIILHAVFRELLL